MFIRFLSLRTPVRSLISLYWIYGLVLGLTSVFTQVFLYGRFQSLSVNILAMMLFYTGCMFSFCIIGYIASLFRLNIRFAYIGSFITTACSFILLLYTHTTLVAYSALFISGIGNGFFWLALHTFELVETKDEERDLYSSFLSAGDSLLSFVGPACATALLWISSVLLHWGTFTLIFIVAPVIYLFGIFFLKGVSEYRPKPITYKDVSHFFISARNFALQLNVAGEAVGDAIEVVVIPAVLLVILGGAIAVGFYTTVLGIGSSICVLVFAKYRKVNNRLIILAYTTVVMIVSLLWLAHALNLLALILYAIMASVAGPLMSVSARAITLRAMESNRRTESDFYASMIIRDFSLWMWRMFFGAGFLLLLSMLAFKPLGFSLGLYLIAGGLVISYIGARTIVTWK